MMGSTAREVRLRLLRALKGERKGRVAILTYIMNGVAHGMGWNMAEMAVNIHTNLYLHTTFGASWASRAATA